MEILSQPQSPASERSEFVFQLRGGGTIEIGGKRPRIGTGLYLGMFIFRRFGFGFRSEEQRYILGTPFFKFVL